MPTILAIETSSEIASVALLRDDKVIAQEASGVHTHSQILLPMVQEVLKQAGVSLKECDAIAFGSGPGSFTGVRTACGTAQGLAFGAELPVIPVITLHAMAQSCWDTYRATDILVLLDARMDEVYWAQYRYREGWETIIEPTLSAPEKVIVSGEVVACGNGLNAYASPFESLHYVAGRQPNVRPHATHIAKLAVAEFAAGRLLHARDAQPIYLRNKVALTTAEREVKVVP